jgi:hypothetical protein
VKSENEQVNYESDRRWIAWNKDALRRLLNKGQLPSLDTTAMPTMPNIVQTPRETTPFHPNLLCGNRDDKAGIVTPSIFETNQNMFDNMPMYGDMTHDLALEDDISDIQAVSINARSDTDNTMKHN